MFVHQLQLVMLLATGTEKKHTADYISNQIELVMKEIGINKFVAVVTDNASVMLKATKILQLNIHTLLRTVCSSCITFTDRRFS